MLLFHLLLLLLLVPALSQSCEQYALPQTSTTCLCPPGFSGPTCSFPSCGGNLFQGSTRASAQPAQGQQYSNLTSSGCTCQSGWGGEGCNVCLSAGACQSGFWASNFNTTVGQSTPDLSGVSPDQTGNQTITCSADSRVYTSAEMSCDVNNPTLQSLFPLQSSLTILRVLNPSLSLYPNVSSLPVPNATIFAQLWYAGVEQFFCTASSCSQTLDTNGPGSTDWMCNDLECHCRAGTDFCGATAAMNLTGTIDQLGGTLEIACDAVTSSTGAGCTFKQTTLDQLFGANGLSLQNCIFGECVRQGVIDNALVNSNGTSTTTASSSGLSGGVIAGLAVVGGIVLAAILLLLWGLWDQRQARKGAAAGAEAALATEKPPGGIGLQFTDLTYIVPLRSRLSMFLRGRRAAREDATSEDNELPDGSGKWILRNVSGRVEPGQMVAILGPSGAGKTTVVELLAGKRKTGRSSGSITFFSGADGHPLERIPRVGFVDQADILPSQLTVRETLLFAARLRLPETMPDASKQARVFEVLDQLGLSHVAETRIGSGERRGVSGGEMRRVSIGCELVARPAVLILDEPTSGLDSVSAQKVASVLHDLCHDPHNPTIVIASIHQPSSKLYRTFDKVMLLSEGKSLYYGEGGNAAAEYFAGKGLPCAQGYNVADHLLDIASAPPPSLMDAPPAQAPANASTESNGLRHTPSEEGEKSLPADHPLAFAHNRADEIPPPGAGIDRGNLRTSGRYAATFLTQLEVLSGREWKNLCRDWSLFFAHLAVSIVLGVFTGGLYFKTGITIAGFQSRIGCLFFLGSLLSFTALSALHNLSVIRPLFLRERAGGYYSPTAWLLSRVIWDVIPLRIIPTIAVSTITYWMTGLSPTPANFFKFLLILILYALVLTLFNFFYAAIFSNGGIAILLSALFNLAQMTFAGFFVHLDSIPPVLRWLQWLCPLKYTLEALSVNEVNSGLMIQDTLSGVPVDVSAQLIMNLLFGFGDSNYYRDVLVLFAFIIGFGIATITAVWFGLRETR
ncbi:hypothetical protein DACRYDRAFT_20168 [Dacryopinax primogenitus]|uniref:ABC transporter domain-containing protein n=1 Tax=Dacryopinax primogenitus (strain DJM 731) TaxID=1858805 RepID=M5GGN3_DACPD|nr:uncharacterized protein DACRYDRAFT_20168 [Dacryopinax primogenitus]EJU05788.1 hypothetical protein DACRYDRAFT_20168 [Dacryopinax primogenitus]